jgi:hypothetical protein
MMSEEMSLGVRGVRRSAAVDKNITEREKKESFAEGHVGWTTGTLPP